MVTNTPFKNDLASFQAKLTYIHRGKIVSISATAQQMCLLTVHKSVLEYYNTYLKQVFLPKTTTYF